MIEAIRNTRYHPGTEKGKPRFPNVMYYIPNGIFQVALQLVIPVVLVTASVVITVGLEKEGGVRDCLLVFLGRFGLPLHNETERPSMLHHLATEWLRKKMPGRERKLL